MVSHGAEVTTHHHPDGSIQAAEANAAGADVFIGLRLATGEARCSAAFYEGYRYVSPGGRRLAELLEASLATSLGVSAGGTLGMSLPVLRETRMPAVICEISPASVVVERGAGIAQALVDSLAEWVDTTWD